MIAIDPNFSVYRLSKRVKQEAVVTNHPITMQWISHVIEDATIQDGANTSIFAGFQRMSRFAEQLPRYQKLAQKARCVYVFGEMDVTPPPIDNLVYIPLQSSQQLAKEWFLISYGRDFFTALATEEKAVHMSQTDADRMFEGILSFDPQLVSIMHDWLCGIVGQRTLQNKPKPQYRQHVALVQNMIERLGKYSKRADSTLKQETETIIKLSIMPVVTKLLNER